MLPEISLNILDVAENSVKAKAKNICIKVSCDIPADSLVVVIKDDGCGMSEEELKRVCDPFFTSRTTRRIGLGVPFFKQSAESSGGSFKIESEKGRGTKVTATYVLSSIDRMPMGDLPATVHQLITQHQDCNILFEYLLNGEGFSLSTDDLREILGDADLSEPEISKYVKDFLSENYVEINKDNKI